MHDLQRGVLQALAAALLLAAVSTFGDWLWTHYLEDGAIVPAIVHGVAIFLILAAVLARCAGTRRAWMRLVPSLPAVGFLLAATFYPLARVAGYAGALLIAWVAMWVITAALQRWARGGDEAAGRAAMRGLAAAVASGLAFWAISGIWTRPSPAGPNYLWHFACWAFAFLPAFLALLVGQPVPAEKPRGPAAGDSGRVV